MASRSGCSNARPAAPYWFERSLGKWSPLLASGHLAAVRHRGHFSELAGVDGQSAAMMRGVLDHRPYDVGDGLAAHHRAGLGVAARVPPGCASGETESRSRRRFRASGGRRQARSHARGPRRGWRNRGRSLRAGLRPRGTSRESAPRARPAARRSSCLPADGIRSRPHRGPWSSGRRNPCWRSIGWQNRSLAVLGSWATLYQKANKKGRSAHHNLECFCRRCANQSRASILLGPRDRRRGLASYPVDAALGCCYAECLQEILACRCLRYRERSLVADLSTLPRPHAGRNSSGLAALCSPNHRPCRPGRFRARCGTAWLCAGIQRTRH